MNLKKLIKKKTLKYLEKKGYQLLKTDEFEKKINYYRDVLVRSKIKKLKDKIDSIVFSKDRALQLHSFLKSYIEMVDKGGTIYIIYKTTNDRHKKSYEELIYIFKNEDFIFIKESDFRKQLIEICHNSSAKIIGFYVDDMIFIQKINYEHILEFDTLNHVVSIGRGKDLDYSIVLERANKLPEFTEVKNGFCKFRWDFDDERSDWTYPLGVGGYFYGNAEINVMLSDIPFKAPNSLENNLQYFKPFFIHRNGVCMDQIVSVAVHANLVQTEGSNPVLDTFSADKLLELWEGSFMIDLSKFYGVSGSVAQTQKYQFIKR